ncbi:MFS transporter [Actinomadura rubrisoli]|uniref:MFS transporter n=1 Tax=Actinomadura rubrisoli TaxID=2530368 RepID=A0A4R5C9G1_9ACTN|nr:MFS transporter [Actinomadura rubrisoli]TDD94830.1 MFS transporter [Actinomadura rubrisoli]
MSVIEDLPPSQDGGKPVPLRRNRDFLLLWTSAGLSTLGMRAAAVAYPLLMVWRGDTVGAGLVGFAALLPQLLVQIPAGVLVDRVPRRRLMIYCDLAGVLSMLGVVLVLASGHMWLPQIMAAAFIEGTAAIVYRLAERAAIRHVLPEDQLSAGLSQNEARGQASGLLGQPVGSGLFAVTRWLPFGLTALTHLAALVLLLMIRRPFEDPRDEEEEKSGRKKGKFRRDIAEGLRWVWQDKVLRVAIALIAGSNIVFQVLAIAIVLVIKERDGSPALVGLIGLIAGLGGVAGALVAQKLLKWFGMPVLFTGTFFVWGIFLTGIAFTGNPVALGVLFGAMVFAGAVMNVAAGIYQVKTTPDRLQGRVGSVLGLVASGMNSVGSLVGGFSLHLFGARDTLLVSAVAMAAFGVIAVATPAIRRAKM